MQLDRNEFSGPLSSDLGNLSKLRVGVFSENDFTGEVSSALVDLEVLKSDCGGAYPQVRCTTCTECEVKYTCYDNSFASADAILYYPMGETWHVCANTTWNTGYWYAPYNSYINGVHPLSLSKCGTKILCGPDGDVKNNCALVSGESGAEVYNPFPVPLNVTDLFIHGFTFTGGQYNGSFNNYTTSIAIYPLDVASVE